MKNIIVIEDSSINDLGGGQRVTLEALAVLKENFNVNLYDLGGGKGFTGLVKEMNLAIRSYGIKSKLDYVIKFPFIVKEIFFSMKNESILHPVTKKALLVSLAVKILRPRVKIVFHQHAKSNAFINLCKKFVDQVVLPGKYNEDGNPKHLFIQNPISIKRVKVAYTPKENREIKLGFIGGLTKLKGFDVYLRACEINGSRMKIAGGGELQHLLGSGKDSEYLGYIGGEEKESFFKDIDILIFPSIIPEPFPLVCFEALFNFNPIVCFDFGYPALVVKKFKTGVVAKDMTPESLAEAIKECQANLEEYSGNCSELIKAYSNDDFKTQLTEVFQKL